MDSAMIERGLLQTIHSTTCAIGYVTVPLERYMRDATRPFFKIVGTGFQVAADRVMTNRHVVVGLLQAQSSFGFDDGQRVVLFVRASTPGRWRLHCSRIVTMGFVVNPDTDIGLVEFVPPPVAGFDAVQPLPFQDEMRFDIGEPIAICGYAYGHEVLQNEGKVYRWGPVLQQGYVSALSPFENTNRPSELLLDTRVAPGMSGAGIVRPADGTVIGILHSMLESTLAIALPLNSSRLEALTKSHDDLKRQAG